MSLQLPQTYEEAQGILAIKQGLLTMLVGPRGGGKTTAADWWVQDSLEWQPKVPRVANVPITNAIYAPDILKLLATKLAEEGGGKNYELMDDNTVRVFPRTEIPSPMLIIIDEAAISGFESRGSGLSPLNSYLLALSRKLNVDIVLVSQMMSMIEKRGQWLSDFYWLCESIKIPGTREIEYFRYRIYDEQYHKTREFHLSAEDAKRHLFGKFDTFDIPNYNELSQAFIIQFQITDEDRKFYQDIIEGKKHIPLQPVSTTELQILEKKWLRSPSGRYPGDTFLMAGKRYEVLQRDWNFDKAAYQYRAREIPNNLFVAESDTGEGEGTA